ncbi:MAG: MGMT family protein [Thermoplasmata archaeon]|nr:MGMT family protein [Thermoplasmata archaeon]
MAAAGGVPGAARLTVWALREGRGLPWHRVVGAGGRIALSGEEGQEQRLRLQMEGVTFRGSRVRMDLHNRIPRAAPRYRDRRSPPPARPPRLVRRRTVAPPRPSGRGPGRSRRTSAR